MRRKTLNMNFSRELMLALCVVFPIWILGCAIMDHFLLWTTNAYIMMWGALVVMFAEGCKKIIKMILY